MTGVLLAAAYFGRHASPLWLGVLAAGMSGLALLARPVLGLFVLLLTALSLPLKIATGTDVSLNPVTLLTPVVAGLWLLDGMRRHDLRFASSRVNRPLLLFLGASLLSLLIGRVVWSPFVPARDNFLLVQLAQWAIFAFSFLAFWLTANLAGNERWLQWLTIAFLVIGGLLALLRVAPSLRPFYVSLTTGAVDRSPFWLLLGGLAGGQLLFNHRLRLLWRVALLAILVLTASYAYFLMREVASTWVGVTVTWGVLIWLRFPQLRVPLVATVLVLAAVGRLFPSLWEFAGGDAEWRMSGESRLILIERVIEMTMQNPITGLGPAAYRVYASWQPLVMESNRLWIGSVVSSHNNYVDIFAHGGVVGLAIFAWFCLAYARLGLALRQRYRSGFAAGYVNAMLAIGAGALVIMLLADWMLPFVYNIGFHGFQASVLVWLFMGGLAALGNMGESETRG